MEMSLRDTIKPCPSLLFELPKTMDFELVGTKKDDKNTRETKKSQVTRKEKDLYQTELQ